VKEDGGYRIRGSKIFITHAGVGEILTLTAVTDPSKGSRGITSFVVTKPTLDVEAARRRGVGHAENLEYIEGVRPGKKEDKMGWRASDTRELLLDDAFVPDGNRLGEEGEGFKNFMKTLDAGRIGIAALSLGLAEGALGVAIDYARKREQFRRPIWDFQPVQFRLADMATDVEAGRHLTYHAAWLKEHGRPFAKEAAMAKLFCSELAMRSTLACIQILGGVGYTNEYPVERMARDSKVCEIGEGTNEVQRMVIARALLDEVRRADAGDTGSGPAREMTQSREAASLGTSE
jgi:alkylation response protein AidB-like acyl-CoA dehydrogenase